VALRTYAAISRFARSRVTEATAVSPREADATYEVRGNWDLRAIRALWRIPQFRGDKKKVMLKPCRLLRIVDCNT